MKKIIVVIATVLSSLVAQSQDGLYMPREVKKAYAGSTRTYTGVPGNAYWQNRASYDISITLAPPSREVRGTEKIVYYNRSKDTLSSVTIRLFLNNHQAGAVRNGAVSDEYLTKGMVIDKFSINGKEKRWQKRPVPLTWQSVTLDKALLPGDAVTLSFDWHYDVSLEANREGVTDSTTFFLAYFYPRIAVYDDVVGWDRIDFTDQQEFYNDFNDYKLTVSVPANFLVWATGVLQNPDEVLQPDFSNRYKKSLTTEEVIHVATFDELKAKKVTQQQAMNQWVFTATEVPDIALNVSDHFVWDAASVIVDQQTGRRAAVHASYNDTAADFRQMVNFGKHALQWFSTKWPGIPYPYPHSTIVQGYADMEYPMMVNDATTPDPDFSRFVAEHEIVHTYFPFMMGINESRYAFMDEGWTTAFELLISTDNLGKEKAERNFRNFRVSNWARSSAAAQDIPIIIPADLIKNIAYGNNAYGKAALGYLALKDLLGDELFKKCLHTFIQNWTGKHPLPWDMFFAFNTVSGQNLNWFWNQWFFSNGYIDVTVLKPEKTKDGWKIHLKNTGGYPAPGDLKISYEDGSKETIHQTPAIWKQGPQASLSIKSKKKITAVVWDGGIYMDAQPGDNQWSNQ